VISDIVEVVVVVQMKEDRWDPMRFIPQTSRAYIVPRIPVFSLSLPLVWDMIPLRLPILSSRLYHLLIPPLHLQFICHCPSPLFAIPPCHVFLMTIHDPLPSPPSYCAIGSGPIAMACLQRVVWNRRSLRSS